MSIAALVRTAAERFSARIAVQDDTVSRTFADLSERAHRVAVGLRRSGLPVQSRVMCLLPNSVDAVEVDLALAIGGFIRVSLNPRVGLAEWLRVMRDCQPQAIILDVRVAGGADFARQTEMATRIIRVGSSVPDSPSLEDIIDAGSGDAELPTPGAESLCALHYSSGTTGLPKGAQRTHGNRLTSLRAMHDNVLAGTLDGRRPAVFLHAGPIIHTSGLFVLPFLEAGGRQVLLEHPTPSQLLGAAAFHRATHTALVPTAISRLLECDDARLGVLRGLRMLAYAGAPMPAAHIAAAFRRITPNLVQYYGMVEAVPPLAVLSPDDHRRAIVDGEDLLTSIGRPCAPTRIAIVHDGRPVDSGVVGELVVGGPAVGPGYHHSRGRADLGKSHVGGILFSGDLGYYGADGYLRLSGRRNDMIISGGYNVYPREVEEALAAIPGVSDVVVVGLPDPVWGQRIAALYTSTGAELTDDAGVLAASRRCLPDFKRPKDVRRVDALPLTPLGKADRGKAARILTAMMADNALCGPPTQVDSDQS
ncbi:AMP-binding protein [Mycobacterium sp. Lab-001]|uniref:class I adenylate-forming enzyme family protein n=1 Tax=Mycobacterium sp. Lab-001 TaxID=3410136 RepID=UPI003D184AB6